MIRAMSTGSVPRGVRSSDTKPTQLSEPPSGGVPRWPLPRWPLLRWAGSSEKAAFVSSLEAAMSLSARRVAAVGAATRRETRPRPLRLSVAAEAAAAPPLRSGVRPSGASVHGLHCRGSRRYEKEPPPPPPQARSQLARSPRARE